MNGKNQAGILVCTLVGLISISIVVLRNAQAQNNHSQESHSAEISVTSSPTNQETIKLIKRIQTSDQTSVNTVQFGESIYEISINCREEWNSRFKKNDKITNDLPPDQEMKLVQDICTGRLQ